MILTKIFKIFCITALFLPLSVLRGEITVAPRMHLENGISSKADAEFLRLALRRIESWARASGIKRRQQKIILKSNGDALKHFADKRHCYITLPGNAEMWRNSFEMRQVIFGALFQLRFQMPWISFDRALKLPVWMTAAVDEAMAQRQESEQYLVGNKDFLALQMLVRQCGELPDFGALCRFEQLPADPGTLVVFSQMSRLLMDLAAKSKLLEPMLRDYIEMRSNDQWVSRFSHPREAQAQLSEMAADVLWSLRMPPPEALMKKQLEPLQNIVLPELDKDGVPTGNMLKLSFSEANKMLMANQRPDLMEIRTYYGRQWAMAGNRQSAEIRRLCRKLSDCASRIGAGKDVANDFNASYRELYRQLAKEEKRIQGFIRHCFDFLPVDQLYLWYFAALRPSDVNGATAEVEKMLERAENDYLKNF